MNVERMDFTGIAYLAAIGIAAFAAYKVWKEGSDAADSIGAAVRSAANAVGDAVGAVASAANPANPDNLVNRVVTKTVQTATGDPTTSLGSWYFDLGVKLGVIDDGGAGLVAPTIVNPRSGATGSW